MPARAPVRLAVDLDIVAANTSHDLVDTIGVVRRQALVVVPCPIHGDAVVVMWDVARVPAGPERGSGRAAYRRVGIVAVKLLRVHTSTTRIAYTNHTLHKSHLNCVTKKQNTIRFICFDKKK